MLPKLYEGYLTSDQLTNSNETKNNENTAGNMNEEEKPDAVENIFQIKFFQRFAKKTLWSWYDRRYRHKLKFRLLLSLQNIYEKIFYANVKLPQTS